MVNILSDSDATLIVPLHNLKLVSMTHMDLDDARVSHGRIRCFPSSKSTRVAGDVLPVDTTFWPTSSAATCKEEVFAGNDFSNNGILPRIDFQTNDPDQADIFATLITASSDHRPVSISLDDRDQPNNETSLVPLPGFASYQFQGNILQMKLYKNESPRDAFDKALIIFKLFKPKLVHSNLCFLQTLGNKSKCYSFLHYQTWEEIEEYTINSSEMIDFVKLWRIYRKKNLTTFSINRFHRASFDPYYIDRIVNYVLALESICVFPPKDKKIAEKVRKIGAHILAEKTGIDKETIERTIGDCYKLRSYIVHNNESKQKKLFEEHDIKHWVQILNNYTRIIINYYGEKDLIYPHNTRDFFNRKLYNSFSPSD